MLVFPPSFLVLDDLSTNALNAPCLIKGEWFDSFAAKLDRHMKAHSCVSSSPMRQRATRDGSPPWTTIWDWVAALFPMFARQIQASLREEKSSSLSDNTAACKPPPLVDSALVFSLQAIFVNIISANLRHKTSRLRHDATIDRIISLSSTNNRWLNSQVERLYSVNRAARWRLVSSVVLTIVANDCIPPASKIADPCIRFDAKLHNVIVANALHSELVSFINSNNFNKFTCLAT
mmetsp:Transcript_30666/g.64245  ORF Transcript_30666/g.64245 Transcript_30666/m.64245 type:complete len:234 (+) Transcript_30666:2779-3480(+)